MRIPLPRVRRLAVPLVAGPALAALLVATSAPARSPEAEAPAAAPLRAPAVAALPERRRLDNGLEVILDEDHRTPIVTVNVWYHVGSKDEAPGRSGFAHLFEHVMFQGSKHVPEDTYFRFLEKAGATSMNGTTNTDRTNYFETVPSNQLELALWLESDRMGFLLDHVDESTFRGQRDVVKNERRQNYENAPYGMLAHFVHAELFPKGHPYHLLTIGSPEDLDAATLEDVRAFFRTNYVPNNASLVLSGDIDKARAMALVETYFGPIPRGARAANAPRRNATPAPPAPHAGETRIEVEAGGEHARAVVSWITPALFAPGDAELDLVAHVLASSKTSRLYKRLVYDLQVAQNVSAYQQSSELASVFEIQATARPGHTAEELVKLIDEELTKLRTSGVEAAELERAKTTIVANNVFELERSSARANRINTYAHYVGEPDYFAKDLARTTDATADKVTLVARTWLREKDRVVTLVTPKKGAPIGGRAVRIVRDGGAK